MLYELTWERLGRGAVKPGETTRIEARDGDDLAGKIHGFARKHLASRWFEVDVYEDGRFSVEASAGRFRSRGFGGGTWAALEAAAAQPPAAPEQP